LKTVGSRGVMGPLPPHTKNVFGTRPPPPPPGRQINVATDGV